MSIVSGCFFFAKIRFIISVQNGCSEKILCKPVKNIQKMWIMWITRCITYFIPVFQLFFSFLFVYNFWSPVDNISGFSGILSNFVQFVHRQFSIIQVRQRVLAARCVYVSLVSAHPPEGFVMIQESKKETRLFRDGFQPLY